MDTAAATQFMSTNHHPVEVNEELNINPLYHSDDGPVTFRMLADGVYDLSDTLDGLETVLMSIPDQADIVPCRRIACLAVKHMQSVVNNLLPVCVNGRRIFYNRSTVPASYAFYSSYDDNEETESADA